MVLLAQCWSLVVVCIVFIIITSCVDAIDDDDLSDLEEFCRKNSQTSLALNMLEHSSPRGSFSHRQLDALVNKFTHFHVESIATLGQHGLFESVAENLSQLLQGYGLQKTMDANLPEAILFVPVFVNSEGQKLITDPTRGIVLVQTEQLCCSNRLSENVVLNLQACETAQNCVILEYSDHNLSYMKNQLQVFKSVVLLPILLQGRLDDFYRRHHLPAHWERSVDLVFFGTQTPHRKTILSTIQNPNPTQPEWEILLAENHDPFHQVRSYLHSKVCLTVHAFEKHGPGEYHRLSELGVSGCLPVMETFLDTLGMEVYKLCGGVVFSDAPELSDKIASILELIEEEEEEQDDSMRRRVEWWKQRVDWSTILVETFGAPKGERIEL